MKTIKKIIAWILCPIMIPLLLILSVCEMWCEPRSATSGFWDDAIEITCGWWLNWITVDRI